MFYELYFLIYPIPLKVWDRFGFRCFIDVCEVSASFTDGMAWRLNKAVVRGEIDNRTQGTVTGTIWLINAEEPVELELEGNCWRDLAGCLLRFENPNPEKDEEYTDLNRHQGGRVGDMTASRKVRVLEIPVKEAYMMCKRGEKPPEHMGNCVYLEWYSDFNGRVVIESTDYRVEISEPVWTMSADEEAEQREANGEAIVKWMERLTGAVSAAERREEIEAAEDKEWSDDDAPMDEFQWEKFLKESDERTDKMMKLYEKYDGIEKEERERLIAREMGWAHIEEYLDAKAHDELPEPDESAWQDDDDFEMPEPDPKTEGIDWVRDTDDGHPVHPLYRRCFDIISAFHSDCKKAGWLDEKSENPLNDLIFSAHMVNAKLAGALNSIWMDRPPDGGFIVAYLKRSLKYFNEAMQHVDNVRKENKADPARLSRFHDDLCGIREDILQLMDKYRGKSV